MLSFINHCMKSQVAHAALENSDKTIQPFKLKKNRWEAEITTQQAEKA